MYELLLQLDVASVLSIFGLQPIKLRWVINICLLRGMFRYIYWGLFAFIILWYRTNTSFYYVLLLIITKICLFHKLQINFIVIFCNTIICCNQGHLRPSESVDILHKANIEIRGVIRVRPIVVREIVTLI